MRHAMRVPGPIGLLFFIAAQSGCFTSIRTDFADAEGGGGAGGRGGGAAGTSGGGGAAGASGGAGAGDAGGGACDPACDATHVCSGGHCLLVDAEPCTTGSQCASGACNPFYKDIDGDGYGIGAAVGFCTLTTPPIGYAAQNGDCCDDATNIALAKSIHPGADFQTTSAGGICGGITWDYDCSGKIEKDRMDCPSCNENPCGCAYVDFPDADCGTNQAGVTCASGAPISACRMFAGGAGPVLCR